MDDIRLHEPLTPLDRLEAGQVMGQYSYDDEMFSPRWRGMRDYAVRAAEQAPPARPGPHPSYTVLSSAAVSPRTLVVLGILGGIIFLCSTATLAIAAMLLDSSRTFISGINDFQGSVDSMVRVGQFLASQNEAQSNQLFQLEMNYTRLESAVNMISTWAKQG